MSADRVDDAVDEIVSALVIHGAEKNASGEVFVIVGITARTAKRAFTSDFDREKRDFAAQNLAPTLHEVLGVNGHQLLAELDFIFRHFGGANGCICEKKFQLSQSVG